MDKEPLGLSKCMRLRARREFLAVYARGEKVHSPHFVLYFLENGRRAHRLGMTISRRIGRSATRNRIRRCLREIFRHNRHHLLLPCDWVLNVKRLAAKASYWELETSFLCSIERWQRKRGLRSGR